MGHGAPPTLPLGPMDGRMTVDLGVDRGAVGEQAVDHLQALVHCGGADGARLLEVRQPSNLIIRQCARARGLDG